MMDSCVGCVENSTTNHLQLSSDSSFRQPDSMNMPRMINVPSRVLHTKRVGLFPVRALECYNLMQAAHLVTDS